MIGSKSDGEWILRFTSGCDSWEANPKVLIDKGMLMSKGIPLLKSRKRTRRNLGIVLRKEYWLQAGRGSILNGNRLAHFAGSLKSA